MTTTNVSKEKREALLSKIAAIQEFIEKSPQDENTQNLYNYLHDLVTEIHGKKYGLVFEEHREEIDEILDTHVPVLNEEKELFIDNGGEMNFLIEGDNLAALQLLEKTHRGKIDVIYIDPPYNTGHKDFKYNDSFVSDTDNFKHSKWLSFTSKRMSIAKNLLADDGVIFISINDIEQSSLKMLCDDIFGEKNYITTFPRKGTGGRQDSTHFAIVHDYVLCYAKSKEKYVSGKELNANKKWRYFDETKQKSYNTQLLRKWGDNSRRTDRPNLYYPIYLSNDGRLDVKRNNPTDIEIYPMLSDKEEGCWRWGVDTMFQNMCNGNVEIKIVDGKYIPYERVYNEDSGGSDIENLSEKVYTSWIDNISSASGKSLIKNMVGTCDFNYPKPVDLIKKIIQMSSPKKDIIVLDFFAGTGTTAHAVLEQNESDSGNRKFIMVTNNENDICQTTTYPRIKKAILGYEYEGSDNVVLFSKKVTYSTLKKPDSILKSVNEIVSEHKEKYDNVEVDIEDSQLIVTGKKKGLIQKLGHPATLKYFKIDYIPISDKFYYEYADELLKHTRELVELENGVNFTGNAEIAIILTDEELEEFISNIDDFEKCRKIYLGHDVLTDAKQEALFKKKNITISVIPDYYYRELEA